MRRLIQFFSRKPKPTHKSDYSDIHTSPEYKVATLDDCKEDDDLTPGTLGKALFIELKLWSRFYS